MEPLLDLLGKFLGAQWLWNLATLAILLQAYKAFDKLRKLPADALSKADFQTYKEAADARFAAIESPLTNTVSRVHTLWKKAGMSDPYVPRASPTYVESMEILEPDPWPRRRATDRLLTPVSTIEGPVEGMDERRYRDRKSDPGRRPIIPREDPPHPPSDRPFDSDPRERSDFDREPFDEDSPPPPPPLPPRPKKR